jgi:hypothetical protein
VWYGLVIKPISSKNEASSLVGFGVWFGGWFAAKHSPPLGYIVLCIVLALTRPRVSIHVNVTGLVFEPFAVCGFPTRALAFASYQLYHKAIPHLWYGLLVKPISSKSEASSLVGFGVWYGLVVMPISSTGELTAPPSPQPWATSAQREPTHRRPGPDASKAKQVPLPPPLPTPSPPQTSTDAPASAADPPHLRPGAASAQREPTHQRAERSKPSEVSRVKQAERSERYCSPPAGAAADVHGCATAEEMGGQSICRSERRLDVFFSFFFRSKLVSPR